MLVFIGSEDEVTRRVAQRLVLFCCNPDTASSIEFQDASPRSNGSQALNNIQKIVSLGYMEHVVSVFDLDSNCIISTLTKHAPKGWKSPLSAINFAQDEAETWLLADRAGVSKYFRVPLESIPTKSVKSGELETPYKSSVYFLRSILSLSKIQRYKDFSDFCINNQNQKPHTYNEIWMEFIRNKWDIKKALENSSSLERAIIRISQSLNASI